MRLIQPKNITGMFVLISVADPDPAKNLSADSDPVQIHELG